MSTKKTCAEDAEALGLTKKEFAQIKRTLERAPNPTELGIFSAMWNEHCSYKSSRYWLRQLPSKGERILHGPGENAGVVDLGNGWAVAFKMESHNHPSFIEPREGAATGVGGILRDVFTMGARPIAVLNCLRFGDPSHPRTRHLVAGVVSGIGDYGNCVGIPTVGGECAFDSRYNGNILVNAMAVGIVRTDRIFLANAGKPGNPVIYAGAKTGRDGIHGASMASAGFSDEAEAKRPTVQIGDPFTEKLLLEACLELMKTDAIIGIQDMGAAGLTSSSVEMAARAGVGVRLRLDEVPVREEGMTPSELMLSESQERMLMTLRPGAEEIAFSILGKWGIDAVAIGEVTDTERLQLEMGGECVADLPIKPLAEGISYQREALPSPRPSEMHIPLDDDCAGALLRLMSSPNLSSRRWIWEQYDQSVMADTIMGPGRDAAIMRLHGTSTGIAITADCTPRYCAADARMGAMQAVVECYRNLSASGALPLAITDCLNFGNPESPEVMGAFVASVEGISEASRALEMPVVSGNVSFYNETDGQPIPPTPQVGAIGLMDEVERYRPRHPREGDALLVMGTTTGHLTGSLYARDIAGITEGPPPPVDLDAEKRNGTWLREQIQSGAISCCHDISDGGLAVAVGEMCLEGDVGARIGCPDGIAPTSFLFGEDQARYLVAVPEEEVSALAMAAGEAGIPAFRTGTFAGSALTLEGLGAISIKALREGHEGWFPVFMES